MVTPLAPAGTRPTTVSDSKLTLRDAAVQHLPQIDRWAGVPAGTEYCARGMPNGGPVDYCVGTRSLSRYFPSGALWEAPADVPPPPATFSIFSLISRRDHACSHQ